MKSLRERAEEVLHDGIHDWTMTDLFTMLKGAELMREMVLEKIKQRAEWYRDNGMPMVFSQMINAYGDIKRLGLEGEDGCSDM